MGYLLGAGVIGGDVMLIVSALVWNTVKFELPKIFQYLIIGLEIILVGVLLLISKPLELAPGNWKPDTEQVFEESEEEESAWNGKSIVEEKATESKNGLTAEVNGSQNISTVIVLEEDDHSSQ